MKHNTNQWQKAHSILDRDYFNTFEALPDLEQDESEYNYHVQACANLDSLLDLTGIQELE